MVLEPKPSFARVDGIQLERPATGLLTMRTYHALGNRAENHFHLTSVNRRRGSRIGKDLQLRAMQRSA